ncbi:hypothetical protein M9H77_11883 [Catharanthus roseus]|uniref:Uncharacterized protein n=1 Tax=Catharanthus roseus TaxID=4058 RepID=A0ACC0BFV0_CATRO|nr:hypothetical protein M9H77_11883 [Catharanthus roseus]
MEREKRRDHGREMVRPGARRENDDLGPVVDRTGKLEERTFTALSRGVRVHHSISNIPSILLHLDLGNIMILVYRGLLPSHLIYQLELVLFSHHMIHRLRYLMNYMDFLSQHLHHMTRRDTGDIELEGDKGRSEEHDEAGYPHIGGKNVEGNNDGDEDEPISVAPTSSSGVRPGSGKDKGLTTSQMHGYIYIYVFSYVFPSSKTMGELCMGCLRTRSILSHTYPIELSDSLGGSNALQHILFDCWWLTGQQITEYKYKTHSKVRETHRLAKGVLSPVLPKIQSSSSSSGSSSDSGSGSCGRGRPPRAPTGTGRGSSSGQSSLSSVIDPSPYSTFPYNTFPGFVYPFIENWKNMNGDRNCGYWVVADCVQG